MNSKDRLRKALESEVPRLSPKAAVRLDAAVDEALARRARPSRSGWRPVLVLAPALALIVVLLLWVRPFGGGERAPGHFLLNEEQLLAALESREDISVMLDEYLSLSVDDLDTETWNDTDREDFRLELEAFQLADNGGKQ